MINPGRSSSAASTALGGRALAALRERWVDNLSPLRDRIRTVGTLRAAPASLGLLLASLAATASVRLPSPAQHLASGVFVYHGRDLHTAAALYRLPLSALLAQSWPQWVWTAFVAVALFAPLEARVGAARLLLCLCVGQVLSTTVVDLIADAGNRTVQLASPDIGTSCLVVSAAAGYAWVTRSRLLTTVVALGLCVDAVLSSAPTDMEHWIAAGTGLLCLVLSAPTRHRSLWFPLPSSVGYSLPSRSDRRALLWW
jgi:membrane associated rhomboid family serine protease